MSYEPGPVRGHKVASAWGFEKNTPTSQRRFIGDNVRNRLKIVLKLLLNLHKILLKTLNTPSKMVFY